MSIKEIKNFNSMKIYKEQQVNMDDNDDERKRKKRQRDKDRQKEKRENSLNK